MKRPLAVFVLAFCAGIFIAGAVNIPFLSPYLAAVTFLVSGALFLKREPVFDTLLICFSLCLGIAALKNTQTLPACHIAKLIFPGHKQTYFLKGFIDSQPQGKGTRTSFIFKAEEVQYNNLRRVCCGRIMVTLKGGTGLSYGEELILAGTLYRPYGFGKYSRGRGYRDYLRNQDVWFLMNIATKAGFVRSGKNKGSWLKKSAFMFKSKIEKVIFKHLASLPAAILDAMVLGERRGIPEFINSAMIKTGTVHILVVSGFNVGTVILALVLLLKLVRLPRKARFMIAIPSVVIYCLMTGASNPVVRATLMAIIFMLGFIFFRQPDISNTLSLSALFILGFNPRQLFEIGFQLSFASVASIVYLYPRIRDFLHLERLKVKFIRFIIDSCLVSLSAWAGTFGLIAYYFKLFSPVTVLANLFIVPLASFITLCGFSLIMADFACPYFAQFFARTSELAVYLLISINALFLKLPFSHLRFP